MTEAIELEHNYRQMEAMRERIERLESGLEHIAKDGECSQYHDPEHDGPERHCSCDVCIARRALLHEGSEYDWRYRGVMHHRIQFMPREARMLRAWSDQVGDERLATILFGGDRMTFPTARDWYVVTTVVQWLATNVGMGVLEAAGFHYKRWNDDKEIEVACNVSGTLGRPNRPKHPEHLPVDTGI